MRDQSKPDDRRDDGDEPSRKSDEQYRPPPKNGARTYRFEDWASI